jgi:hypothetical protein
MRDNHDQFPELLSAYKREGQYFGEITVCINEETRSFEFGLSLQGYQSLIKILSYRPFDATPGIKYHYFFTPTIHGTLERETNIRTVNIRIEQGKNGKEFEFELSTDLIANLKWFFELKNFNDASYLKELTNTNK